MDRIIFIDRPDAYNRKNAFIAHFKKINSKERLIKELGNKLRFPDYYGLNWDALSDCLRDFHWINNRNIVLVHDEIPNLDELDWRTYIHILINAIESWEEEGGKRFEVVFPKNFSDLIAEYLR